MYRDIADYGLIGDMHSVALVSKDGSIDYCSMPHIDSPTVFAALLDDEKGGFFKIQPEGSFESEQRYIKDTNILSCVFKTETGQAELVDFMPISTQELFYKGDHIIHRCLKVISGTMDFKLECLPRPRYASELPFIEKNDNLFRIMAKREVFTFIAKTENYEVIENKNSGIIIRFSLREGQSAHFDFIYGDRQQSETDMCGFEETHKFWVDWLHNCITTRGFSLGEYTDMINRSLLALKLLTFQPTGAIAAAATTSLPESIAGQRNWDYRFTWLRDASFTLKALFSLGHISEADSFIRWLHGTYQKYGSRKLQIMYSLKGESNLAEKTLDHLKGYKNSKPVRVGNTAFGQNQWDIYGEIMDAALRLSDYAGKIDENLWPFFRDICNLAVRNWRRPDEGIWEVRNGPFHFVYSKVMCWVALDRGIKIARRYGFDAPLEKWQKEKEEIKKDILSKGYDPTLDSFVQRYGSRELDASLLLLGLMNFLPFDDRRIRGTIEACKKYLMKEGFLLRYLSADGLKGKEGAFILCNFWLIESLVFSGKATDAEDLLTKTLKAANHLGLFSEEYDFERDEMLGNFPQAFSHIGFINAALAILNVRYREAFRDKGRSSWLKRIERRIPFKIILNKTDESFGDTDKEIAYRLKIALNNLQGAFFNVTEGRVNYNAMKRSESYKSYLRLARKLNAFDPSVLKTDDEKKAFWINIYNILIIHGVIELDVESSVKEVFNFFGRIGYTVNGLYFTPDDIEHGILRANKPHPGSRLRQFSWFDKRKALCVSKLDPRIHFALVCAASSCPPIEFYDAANINSQLDISQEEVLLTEEASCLIRLIISFISLRSLNGIFLISAPAEKKWCIMHLRLPIRI
jgi:GH15 family glucan-1,4-alpha-glucosidase